MDTTAPVARTLYRWCALLALPGGTWAAFEMYGLTMRGPQMLFFSISHTLFPMVLAVFLSVPSGILWLLQTLAALSSHRYREGLGIPVRSLLIFTVALSVHALLLGFYDFWSYVSALRVPLCVLGIVFTVVAVRESWRQLRSPIAPA
jgi:hypothetical protein